MHEKPTLITERVDVMPLGLAQVDRMDVAEVRFARCPSRSIRRVAALDPVQWRFLEMLGVSSVVSTRLEAVAVEPP